MSEIIPSISSGSSDENSGSRSFNDSIRPQNRPITEDVALNESSWSGIVTSFTVYRLLSEIIKPFTSMKAYQAGLIDANGNLMKTERELTREEESVLTPFARLVIGIKRLVQALPSTRYKADFGYIQTAARAMAFECSDLGGDAKLFLEELEKSLDVLLEDGEGGGFGNEVGGGFSNPQVGEPNPALAGFSPPMAFVRRLPTTFRKKKVKLKKRKKK